MTVTRLVLESAKKDLEPEEFQHMTVEHRHAFRNAMRTEASPPPGFGPNKVVPDARLPPRHFGERLVQLFCRKSLYMLPVLHEPTFMKEVADVYEGSTDPFKTFKLKMVLAISLQKYSVAYSSWADSYFLSGLQDLDKIMEPMDHNTLQCLLVMVQYALVKPTRIAVSSLVSVFWIMLTGTGLSYGGNLRTVMHSTRISSGKDNHVERAAARPYHKRHAETIILDDCIHGVCCLISSM